jgi:hypothetical protein
MMGTTTNIRELRERAKDLVIIADYKDRFIFFWKNTDASEETIEVINHIENLFEKIQSANLPQDIVEIVKIGHQIHDFAEKVVETTKDGTPLNIMIREFISALGDSDVQSIRDEDGETGRGV